MTAPADTFSLIGGSSGWYGGRTKPVPLPSFVPAPGQLKSIHLNDLAALNPCPGDQCWYSQTEGMDGPWDLWCGGVFAADYSTYGAMVYQGGGHRGSESTSLIIFDISTQKWSLLNQPEPTDFTESIDATWLDYQSTIGNGLVVPATHVYSFPAYVSAARGGGPKGTWVLPYQVYNNDVTHVTGVGYAPHAVDLATGHWSRYTDNTYAASVGSDSPSGMTWVDTKRNIMWCMCIGYSRDHVKIDLNTGTKTMVPVLGQYIYAPGYYFVGEYVEAHDMFVAAYCDYNTKLVKVNAYDVSSGSPQQFTVNVANPLTNTNGPGMGFAWCPDTGKFYAYEGVGTTVVYTLTPPAGDWKTGTWTWGVEQMGDEAPVNILNKNATLTGAQPLSKWRYNPKLKSFMWSQGRQASASPDGVTRTGAFQLYRPLGT